MRRRRWITGLFGFVLAALPPADTAAAETITLTHQGATRSAILHRPVGAPAGPRPLVIALHGQGGTGQDFRRWAALDAIANRGGFAVIYPDAVDGRWSYGRPIRQPMPTVAGEPADDIGFLRALIAALVARGIADPSRIYVFGVSRGGLMTFTAACALDDVIAAGAAIVTGMTDHQREDCRPARAVPLVVIAGTADTTQFYDGWVFPMGRLLSVPETLEFWRTRHGCGAQEATVLPHRRRADPTRVVLVEWTECATEKPLRYLRVEGGGHQMPSTAGRSMPLSESKFGRRNHDFETADEAWAFFKRFAR